MQRPMGIYFTAGYYLLGAAVISCTALFELANSGTHPECTKLLVSFLPDLSDLDPGAALPAASLAVAFLNAVLGVGLLF